jgi:hypothetical protein
LAYRVTIRHGSQVERESFKALEPALAAARRAAEAVLSEGPLRKVKMLREFEPSERVAARIEVSRGGPLRGASAGVDVMGDGSMVAFAGSVRRRSLEPARGEDAFDAVERELR